MKWEGGREEVKYAMGRREGGSEVHICIGREGGNEVCNRKEGGGRNRGREGMK